MDSLWFSGDDTDLSDDPCLGIFVASPSVIAATLPRPKAPFVGITEERRPMKYLTLPKEDSSDSLSYESPIAKVETTRRRIGDRPAISVFDLLA
jgi:hypothetical protein